MFSTTVGHCVPCFVRPQADCWRIGSSNARICQRNFGIWWKNKWCDNRNIGTMLFRKTDWHLMPTLVTILIHYLLSFGFDRFRCLSVNIYQTQKKAIHFTTVVSNFFFVSIVCFGYDMGRGNQVSQTISLLYIFPVFGVFFSSCQNWKWYQTELRGNEFFSERTYFLFTRFAYYYLIFSVFIFFNLSSALLSITQSIILGKRWKKKEKPKH